MRGSGWQRFVSECPSRVRPTVRAPRPKTGTWCTNHFTSFFANLRGRLDFPQDHVFRQLRGLVVPLDAAWTSATVRVADRRLLNYPRLAEVWYILN